MKLCKTSLENSSVILKYRSKQILLNRMKVVFYFDTKMYKVLYFTLFKTYLKLW